MHDVRTSGSSRPPLPCAALHNGTTLQEHSALPILLIKSQDHYQYVLQK